MLPSRLKLLERVGPAQKRGSVTEHCAGRLATISMIQSVTPPDFDGDISCCRVNFAARNHFRQLIFCRAPAG